ncbi:hypothetical protein ABXT16_11430 [Staphylococcus epidermidis]|uniref:hypothetical protein n=2 Tax=Staphylococcus epidermidis TaxID=1282 RepID=UPI00339121C4
MAKYGVLKVNNNEEIFSSESISLEEKHHISEILNTQNIEDIKVDFDQNTLSDFIDILEFMECEYIYIFVNKPTDRLKNILKIINKDLDIEFIIYCTTEQKYINSDKSYPHFNLSYNSNIDLENRISNSNISIHTGLYSYPEKVHIKHILLDDIQNINALDKSIFLNCGLNSVIITNDYENEKIELNDYTFPKLMSFYEFENKLNSEINFLSLSKEQLVELIEKFQLYGLIKAKEQFHDIGRMVTNPKLNTIFIKESAIYFDYSNKHMLLPIDNQKKVTVFEILNSINSIKDNFEISYEIATEFYLSYILSKNVPNIKRFISKNTEYKLSVDTQQITSIYENWIGFITKDSWFIFNKLSGKMFEVNELFLEIFEGLVKNKKSELSNINSEIINEAEGLLKNE